MPAWRASDATTKRGYQATSETALFKSGCNLNKIDLNERMKIWYTQKTHRCLIEEKKCKKNKKWRIRAKYMSVPRWACYNDECQIFVQKTATTHSSIAIPAKITQNKDFNTKNTEYKQFVQDYYITSHWPAQSDEFEIGNRDLDALDCNIIWGFKTNIHINRTPKQQEENVGCRGGHSREV